MFKELNILKIFLENPTKEFNVREVARIIKVSPATVSKKLEEFRKKSVLLMRNERIFKFYKANLENQTYRYLKIFYNIMKLYDSGLINELNRFYLKPTIVLFGSAAKGLDTETSDFDLLILSEKSNEFNKVKEYEKKLNRKLHLFVINDINDIKNKRLLNNILNGIVLEGRIKWI